jgi:hypothetical protein
VIKQAQPFDVDVSYIDQAGQNRWRTKLFISQPPDGEWIVRQVAWYNGMETEPFAMSGPV